MRRLIGLIIFLIGMGDTVSAEPVLYQYEDEDGVVTFTNKPESIPEGSRDSLQAIERSDLPPLLTNIRPTAPSAKVQVDPWYRHWAQSPWFKPVVGLGVLTLLSFTAVHFGAGSLLLRVSGKLLLVVFIGASVYSLYLANQFTAYQKITSTSASSLKKVSPIERAAQSADALEKKMDDQEDLLQSIEP